jgi:hypothetical protein
MKRNTMLQSIQRVAATAAMLVIAFGTENVEAQLCCTTVFSDCKYIGIGGHCNPYGGASYQTSYDEEPGWGGARADGQDPCYAGTAIVFDQMELLERTASCA